MPATDSSIVIVPAYNEEGVITSTLQEITSAFKNVVCIDDGSSDDTGLLASQVENVTLLTHCFNIGQGGAIETGVAYGLDKGFQYFVTIDADGQHLSEDALQQLNRIEKGDVDIVLGSRFINHTSSIPWNRRFILKLGVLFTRWATGLKLSDTHNGLRTFNRDVAKKMRFLHKDMGHASNILSIISKHNFRYVELPSNIQYTEYSVKKGQSLLNSINILFDLFIYRG